MMHTLISRITGRMILPREACPIWLGDTDASLAQVKAELTTFDRPLDVSQGRAAIQHTFQSAKDHAQADLF